MRNFGLFGSQKIILSVNSESAQNVSFFILFYKGCRTAVLFKNDIGNINLDRQHADAILRRKKVLFSNLKVDLGI